MGTVSSTNNNNNEDTGNEEPSSDDNGSGSFAAFGIFIFLAPAIFLALVMIAYYTLKFWEHRRRPQQLDLERQQHERELEAVAIDEESVGKELEFTPEEADALQEHLGADYTCPISRDVFHNPVIAADGKTYDYKYIRSWLGVRAISPLTNTPMSHCNLEPDVETRDEIEKALTELREKGKLTGTPRSFSGRQGMTAIPVIEEENPPETDDDSSSASALPHPLVCKI
mmetsp:Transcript_13469/g.49004  ORF Transcript_13469/g.49004 Transcript_13469/m.49004 type:complete len:227 (+) Transcript_13469:213-893(+)